VKRNQALDFRVLLWLVVLVVIAGGVALVTTSGGSSGSSSAGAPKGLKTAQGSFDAEGVLTPVRAAPALSLRNYLGQRVNIDSYKGKAVLVTFLYTNCPDVCPLITANLHEAQSLMGPAVSSKAEIIAVSVDPRGDTPKAVASFLARHGMTGRMQYLIGSAAELAKVWKAWGVGSSRDTQNPQFVNHSGLIYGVTASGKRLTVYTASFEPKQVAHDVPLLAAR